MGQLEQLYRSKAIRLTVVVAVVLLAARWLFNAPTVSENRQKKVRTQTNATGLLQAIEGHYREYGSLPEFGAQGNDARTEGQSGTQLLTILLGTEEVTNTMQNKKQIRFLTVAETKTKKKGGLLYSSSGSDAPLEGLYDAWGNAFCIRFDNEHDQKIPDPFKPGEMIRNKVAIVFSYGADGKPGTADDVKTW